MACECCPFAFTDASEEVQNYGCLPTPYDIIQMKRKTGHNWACHSNEKKICKGFVDHVKWSQENAFADKLDDIDTSKGNLISYETWYYKGEEEAIKEADSKEHTKKG
ncbi:hypothetical protein BAOM_3028 [Peribacillus asahii]|uniref:Uncharacterized protein n=1 Tax=Peribacillus asahii TaxID=228899 RepID=A0A3T0KT97_9BACI|nr:hypothetical protein [Peribacillus asahii]AZV43637.1 hypothetical protein BAOM_3028 [Peribacillus asahii]